MLPVSILHPLLGSAALLLTSAALAQQPDSLRPASAAPAAPAAPVTRFKLGLDVPRVISGYWGATLPLYAGVERQLGRHWSFTADANIGVGAGFSQRSTVQLARFGLAAGVRYYYGQERRQRQGKPVAAISGFYVQAQANTEFNRYIPYYGYDTRSIYYLDPNAELLWGYQRSLGRHGFVDAGAGLRVQRERVYDGIRPYVLGVQPMLRARVGFAL